MSIALNIKGLREQHQLTQKELAAAIGISEKTISAYERGVRVPLMGVVEKLARYFEVPNSAIVDNVRETDEALYDLMQSLSKENRQRAEEYMRLLASSAGRAYKK